MILAHPRLGRGFIMSVFAKTAGVVAIGLVGLFVYLFLQVGSFFQLGIAGFVTYLGLFLTFAMLVLVMYLTSAPAPADD